MLGLNQVIMMALSIVVIASLIGAGGLGDPVLDALQNEHIGEGFIAGVLIVFMAMWLDRTSAALGQRRRRAATGARSLTRNQLLAVAAGVLAVILVANYAGGLGDWPSGWGFSIETPATNTLNWITGQLTGRERVPLELPHAQRPEPAAALSERPARGGSSLPSCGAVAWQKGGPRRCVLLVGCVVLLGLMQAPGRLHVPGDRLVRLLGLERCDGDPEPRRRRARYSTCSSGSRSGSPPTAGGLPTRCCGRSSTSCRRCRRSST